MSQGHPLFLLLLYSLLTLPSPYKEILLLVFLAIVEIIRSLFFGKIFDIAYKISMQIRGAFCTIAYDMMLKPNNSHLVGPEAVNLLDLGGNKFLEMFRSFFVILFCPVVVIVVLVLTFNLMGWPAIIAILCLLLTVPFLIKTLTGTIYFNQQIKIYEDKRSNFLGEIFKSMRLIKSLCWEDKASKIILNYTEIEKKYYISRALRICVFSVCSILSTVLIASIALPMYLSNRPLDAISVLEIFVSIVLWANIANILKFFPMGLKCLVDTKQACLNFQKLVDDGRRDKPGPLIGNYENPEFLANSSYDNRIALEIQNCGFKFFEKQEKAQPRQEQKISSVDNEKQKMLESSFQLSNLNLKIYKNELIGICGQTSSGKSALLKSIIGLLDRVPAEDSARPSFIKKYGSLAYYSQRPWITFGTVKDNIILASEFHQKKKYSETLAACCLKPDFKQFKHGDQTILGDNGAVLSGGQQARISFARAVYSERDIYLLDDPLAAVDKFVAGKLFNHAIKDTLIQKQKKTVLLASHQINFLKECDKVICLDGGQIVEFDTPKKLLANSNSLFYKFALDFDRSLQNRKQLKIQQQKSLQKTPFVMDQKLNENMSTLSELETPSSDSIADPDSKDDSGDFLISSAIPDNTGKISIRQTKQAYSSEALKFYLQHWGGVSVFLAILIFYFLACLISYSSFMWISIFIVSTHPERTPLPEVYKFLHKNPNFTSIQIFTAVMILIVILVCLLHGIRSIIYSKVAYSASVRLQKTLLDKVLKSPMEFFDTTPLGETLSPFTKEMNEINFSALLLLETALIAICTTLTCFVIVVAVYPIVGVCMVVCVVVVLLIFRFSTPGSLTCLEIEKFNRINWRSHILGTINGKDSIKAYDLNDKFKLGFNSLLRKTTRPYYLFQCIHRYAQVLKL